jgi:hypothetical protein
VVAITCAPAVNPSANPSRHNPKLLAARNHVSIVSFIGVSSFSIRLRRRIRAFQPVRTAAIPAR